MKKPRMNTTPCFPIHAHHATMLNGMTSGTWRAHLDRRTSWARTACYRQRAMCGRTGQGPA